MNDATFDTLAKDLAVPSSRRKVLRGVAAVVAAGMAGRLGFGADVAAGPRRPPTGRTCREVGSRCMESASCCSGTCSRSKRVCECGRGAQFCKHPYTGATTCVAPCPAGQVLDECQCVCPGWTEYCNGVCCDAGENCVRGVCQPPY